MAEGGDSAGARGVRARRRHERLRLQVVVRPLLRAAAHRGPAANRVFSGSHHLQLPQRLVPEGVDRLSPRDGALLGAHGWELSSRLEN